MQNAQLAAAEPAENAGLGMATFLYRAGDIKRPTSRNRASISGRFRVATFLYRAEGLQAAEKLHPSHSNRTVSTQTFSNQTQQIDLTEKSRCAPISSSQS